MRTTFKASTPLVALIILPCLYLISPCYADDNMAPSFTSNPPFLKEYQDVEFGGDLAVIFAVGGLVIYDLAEQNLVGVYTGNEAPVRMYRGAVGGDYVYAGAREDLLQVIDISNPLEPQLATVHGAAGQSFEGMAIKNGYLFAARHGDGLEILDLADPAAPTAVAEIPALVHSWDVAFQDNVVYVADGAGGLAVIDATNPAVPRHLLSVPTAGSAVDVCVSNGLALVALGSAGVDVFDISDPVLPQWRGNYNSSALAISVEAVGDTLYLADWDDIEVIDLSFPASPHRIGFEMAPVRAMGLAARGNEVILADWGSVRGYRFEPTFDGDLHLPFKKLAFEGVPPGSTEQLTFECINTGGGSLVVTGIQTFSETITVEPPTAFTVNPGQTHEVTLNFSPGLPGFDATFLRIDSDDPDESVRIFPVVAGNDPNSLELGEMAPDFTYFDLQGASHSLSDYLGEVVVLAFFANL
jgi:hypothetical protein